MKKAVIFEYNQYHEEVILPQALFLRDSGYKTTIYINEELLKKNLFNDVKGIEIVTVNNSRKRMLYLSMYFCAIRLFFHNPNVLIFNTYKNEFFNHLISFFTPFAKKIGIIHNMDILNQEKLGLKRFMFLSENLKKYAEKNYPQYSHSFFYPLLDTQTNNAGVKKTEVRICIPGLVQFKRRDYLGLINLVNKERPKNVKFIILGNGKKHDGPQVLSEINEKGLKDYFETYEGFVPYETYFSEINNADMIMALIHPGSEHFEDYHHSKITGCFNMAFSGRIPLFMYDSFEKINEFANFAMFYNFENFKSTIENLQKEKLVQISKNIENHPPFQFKNQRKLYTDTIENIFN